MARTNIEHSNYRRPRKDNINMIWCFFGVFILILTADQSQKASCSKSSRKRGFKLCRFDTQASAVCPAIGFITKLMASWLVNGWKSWWFKSRQFLSYFLCILVTMEVGPPFPSCTADRSQTSPESLQAAGNSHRAAPVGWQIHANWYGFGRIWRI